MSTRRANGEGSPYRDLQRGGWRGSIMVAGQRRSVRGRTQAAVLTKLKNLREGVAQGVGPPPSRPFAGTVLLRDHLAAWLLAQEHRVDIEDLRPRTLDAYSRCVRLYLDPILGDIPVKKLSVDHLTILHTTMAARSLGNSTIAQAQRTLGTALETLVATGHLALNVAHKAPSPRLSKLDRPDALAPQQFDLMMAGADPENLAMNPSRVLMGCILGMREGEAAGLLITDLDLRGRQVQVTKQLSRPVWRHGAKCDRHGHTEGKCPTRIQTKKVGEVKTPAGVRTITIPAKWIPLLQAHVDRIASRRKLLGKQWQDPKPWLFPSAFGGRNSVYADGRAWAKLVKRTCGPSAPTGTHAARRHAATRLAEKGIPQLTAASILGWSGPGQAEIYTRFSAGHLRDAMDLAWE